MTEPPLLRVEELCVTYGTAQAVSGVSLDVAAGAAIAILGANGAGKSSFGRAVCGLTPSASGTVHFAGTDISGQSATLISRLGLAYLPEGRGIFPNLSVNDNLRVMLRSVGRADLGAALDEAYTLFPRLAERRKQIAKTLSGGEQQMLALARVLVTRPRLVIADEPSLGLAPKLIELIFETLAQARAAGTAIVLIEQYVHRAIEFCDAATILRRGTVAWSGTTDALGPEALTHYLGHEELSPA